MLAPSKLRKVHPSAEPIDAAYRRVDRDSCIVLCDSYANVTRSFRWLAKAGGEGAKYGAEEEGGWTWKRTFC